MRVLQTLALPLGDVAIFKQIADSGWRDHCYLLLTLRAGDETRTHDLLLGKEVFYQLNYARTMLDSAETQD